MLRYFKCYIEVNKTISFHIYVDRFTEHMLSKFFWESS
jgi:hypothetical protein